MNTSYVEEITSIFDNQNLNYEILENLSISNFDDYKCYYLLVEKRLLYAISIGEADSQKSLLFFKNLQKVAQLYSSKKLTFIMDATQLHHIPASVRNEIHFFDLSFRKYWSKVLFIYEGVGKVIMDMYELHKPEHLEGVEKINKPHLAIDYALSGKKTNVASNDYLNSLSKKELIAEVKRLKAKESVRKTDVNSEENQVIDILTNLSWDGKNTELLQNDEEGFSPIKVLINTIVADYKQISKELEEINGDFFNKLQFQVGEILHQEATLRAIFDSLESIVWMIDADYSLLAFNSKFYEHVKVQYGISPEVGMNLLEQKEITSLYDKTIKRIKIALTGKEESYRDFYEENGQVVKVVDSKVFPVLVNKEISGVVCITDDITESFEVKEKVKSNERIIASVNKNISEAIYRSTHDRGLVFINEAFVRMFGFDSKEELYKHSKLNSLYANPDDRERLGNLLIKKKEVRNVEVQFRRKNGEIFTGLISSMLSEDEEGATYFDGAIRDVTAIKSAQEKLKKQNRELKKLNTELDSFVYSASHDLKAPLSSVKGLINLAKDESDKDKLAYYLDLVDKSINKLDDFIKDIVDLSRNARQEVKAEAIDFEEMVKDTLDNYKYLEDYDKIEKRIKIESNVSFYSDKRRLKVVFNNLISNSIRYFNPFVDHPFVEILIKTNVDSAVIKISDNGLGIENQYLEKIFDMFFRASNNSKGTGIGLYIVKETIQKVKGEIQVQSEVQKGTTFTISFPNLRP